VIWGSFLAGFVIGGAGLLLIGWPEIITNVFHIILSSHESYLEDDVFSQPTFIHKAGIHAGLSLGLAGLVLIITGSLLLLTEKWPLFRWGVPLVLLMEMIGFAGGQITLSHLSDAAPDDLRQFVAAHPGDYRVFNYDQPNNGFLLGAGDMWGNNPAVLERYAEFITFTQRGNPDRISQYLNFIELDPLYAMLRFRYAFSSEIPRKRVTESPTPPLPHLLLLSDWKVLDGRNSIFMAMRAPSFHPDKTVLLENEPEPHPEPGATGSVKLIRALPDELTIEADIDKPALLLITDLYTRSWRAETLPGSVQSTYSLMPADYILRGIPLAAGHHHLRVVYAPISFPIGIGISTVALILWLGLYVLMGGKTLLRLSV